MNKKILIYLGIITLLVGVLIWSNFFMKEAYVLDGDGMSSIPKVPTLRTDEPEVKPDFLPQDIPAEVVETAKEYDYFYYLFLHPYKKVVLYTYTPGSILVEDSEKFHNEISDYIKHDLYMGNYKIIFTTVKGAQIYQKRILDQYEEANYEPKKEDSKLHREKMLKKKAKIDAVTAFYNECAQGMCIIYADKMQYIAIDKRHTEVAKKLLNDYKRW